jgi:hypothetical protein
VLYPHRRNLPRRVRVFIDWIERILSDNYRGKLDEGKDLS